MMAYYGLTKRLPYAEMVRAEAPTAMSAFQNKKARDLQQQQALISQQLANKSLTQSGQQFEESLANEKEQSLAALNESKRQFAENYALQQQQAEEAAKQGQLSTGIATAGLGLEAAPYIKSAGTGIYNSLFADSAAATPATIGSVGAPGGSVGLGLSGGGEYGVGAGLSGSGNAVGAGLGGSSASGASAGGGGGLGAAGIGGIIAAAAAGQMLASNSADPVEGQKPGHFFSFDDGNWKPWFSEPDKNYFSQQLGGGPTTGARFDARLQQGDIGGAAKALPGFAHGYAVPGLDVAGNVVGDWAGRQFGERTGDRVHSLIDPIGKVTRDVANAKDIGDVGKTVFDTAGTLSDPLGGFVGDLANKTVTNWTGNETLGKAADWLVNPIGNAFNTISSWF